MIFLLLYDLLEEAPLASKEKVEELLAYLLSIEGENEFSPFLSRSFLLPMICQATMTTEGVKMLASSGAYKAREHIKVQLDEAVFVQVLKALTYWTEGTSDSIYIMMASSIYSLIFDNTSEKALLTYPGIDISILHKLSQLIARSLVVCAQENCNNANSDVDLHQIIAAGYSRWADRFPLVREAVGR